MSGVLAAVDLGATSGRVVVGDVGPDRIVTKGIARFPNQPVRTIDGLQWNLLGLYQSVLVGVGVAVRTEREVLSIGVDSWAVDYGLLRHGRLLANPYHYRDERTAGGVEAVDELIGRAELYERNGIQFLPFNTVYQLAADGIAGTLEVADSLLLLPDLMNYWLTGQRFAESTNASTTGLFRAATQTWDLELIERIGFRTSLFAEIVEPGASIGETLPLVTAAIGSDRPVPVMAVGSHDTASAVAAVPMAGSSAAYISCGTWGLVGLELDSPVQTAASEAAGFTNEGGVDGRIRFLHNVMGLWLLNESIRQWELEGETISLSALLSEAAEITSDVARFDVNDELFLAQGNMPARIAQHCRERGLPVPTTKAEFARSIIESLASAFADTVRTAVALTDRPVDTVHMVGGGALNALLCQRTADQLELRVVAGPVEATAIGNLLVQARSVGLVDGGLDDLRAIVERSTDLVEYRPNSARGRS